MTPCVNLGSYNYLGFADDWDTTCRKDVMAVARAFPVSGCTSHAEGGYTALHAALEECVADFLGKEAAVSRALRRGLRGWQRRQRAGETYSGAAGARSGE